MAKMNYKEMIDNLSGLLHDMTYYKCFNNDYIDALRQGISELKKETVSREAYEHEYFLRKDFETQIMTLKAQIEALKNTNKAKDV